MDGAIELYGELARRAVEIEDEPADGVLAAELQTAQPPPAERAPEPPLGGSEPAPQSAGRIVNVRRGTPDSRCRLVSRIDAHRCRSLRPPAAGIPAPRPLGSPGPPPGPQSWG